MGAHMQVYLLGGEGGCWGNRNSISWELEDGDLIVSSWQTVDVWFCQQQQQQKLYPEPLISIASSTILMLFFGFGPLCYPPQARLNICATWLLSKTKMCNCGKDFQLLKWIDCAPRQHTPLKCSLSNSKKWKVPAIIVFTQLWLR